MKKNQTLAGIERSPGISRLFDDLDPLIREILKGRAAGKTLEQLGHKLGLSLFTIRHLEVKYLIRLEWMLEHPGKTIKEDKGRSIGSLAYHKRKKYRKRDKSCRPLE